MNSEQMNTSNRPRLLSYITGFILSLGLTLAVYQLVQHHVNSGHISPSDNVTVAILSSLAIIQLFVQMFFFLHLGREGKPRWRLITFVFALLIVAIIVFGSLWIMHNLNYRMTPQQINNYLHDQDGGI